jgi:hypothetical protein
MPIFFKLYLVQAFFIGRLYISALRRNSRPNSVNIILGAQAAQTGGIIPL